MEAVRKAAEKNTVKIREVLQGSEVVICTTGLGGMAGTGAIPVMVQATKDVGALSVAVVTLPFTFESEQRKKRADNYIEELKRIANTVIVIPRDLVPRGKEGAITLQNTLSLVDKTVLKTIKSIIDTIHTLNQEVIPDNV